MKKKFITAYCIFVSLIFVFSIFIFAYNVFFEYKNGQSRADTRFEYLSLSIKQLSMKKEIGSRDFYNQLNEIIGSYDDFAALKAFVVKCKDTFDLKYDMEDSKYYHTISQNLFVVPYNDLFAKMTLKQQDNFYNKLCHMLSRLEEATKKEKKSEACSILAEVFGSDFPVKTERSYVGHSESA